MPHPFSDSPNQRLAATAVLGYRYQDPGGVVFRLAFAPVLVSRRLVPAFGLGIGYSVGALLD